MIEELNFGPVVFNYTRAQAIADGVLVDITEKAHEAGFRLSVAMTAAAWTDCVAWTERDSARQTSQDEIGRLWDVVWMALIAAKRAQGNQALFQVFRVQRGGRATRASRVTLKMHIGPGDNGEPVITIMMPNED